MTDFLTWWSFLLPIIIILTSVIVKRDLCDYNVTLAIGVYPMLFSSLHLVVTRDVFQYFSWISMHSRTLAGMHGFPILPAQGKRAVYNTVLPHLAKAPLIALLGCVTDEADHA